MIAARLNLSATDLPDDLQKLHSMIARDVPAGVGQGHDDGDAFDAMPGPGDHELRQILNDKGT